MFLSKKKNVFYFVNFEHFGDVDTMLIKSTSMKTPWLEMSPDITTLDCESLSNILQKSLRGLCPATLFAHI